jgi:CIC family chloride channel protein
VNNLMSGDVHGLLDRSLFFGYGDNQWFLLVFIAALILLKVVAAAITVGSGGNGGIFGPSLFAGAFCGYFFSHGINLTGITRLNEPNFVVVAMCGLISGVLHAPLTGIFLIAEVTGGYVLFVPLMLVSATAFFITRYFEPHSIYTKTLIERGFIRADKDTDLLHELNVSDLIETNFTPVAPDATLGELVQALAASRRNLFPVVAHNGKLEGVITVDEIRDVLFNREVYEAIAVKDLMSSPQAVAYTDESVDRVMRDFEQLGIWNVPVLDRDGKYVGFISKSGILDRYRAKLIGRSRAVL